MDWTKRTAPVQVGDIAAYSKHFLQSTGQYTGDAPQARGKVIGLTTIGSIILAEIAWDGDVELPTKVNIKNLSRVKYGVVMDRD